MSQLKVPPLEVLHLDEHLIVVNKRSGMLVHRSRESSDRIYLLQTLNRQLGRFLYPVHRLDRPVSGAIAFALSSEVARRLAENLKAPEARKEYIALVRGETAERGVLERPLTGENGERRPCRTEFERLAVLSGFSLVRAWIHTGRRHQIRRHFSHARHQLVGDTTYGKGGINRFFRAEYGLERLFLHAHRLSFRHPASGELLEVAAPLSPELRGVLERLACPPEILETL